MPFEPDYRNTVLTGHIKPTTTFGMFNASGVELTAIGGYARKEIGELDTSIPGQIANKNTVFLFEATGGNSDTAVTFTLFNGSTKVFSDNLVQTPVSGGYVPLIRPYSLVIGLDKDELDEY